MLLSIALYTLIWILCSILVFHQYKLRNKRMISYINVRKYTKKKITIIQIILIALLFTIYNLYATRTSVNVGDDRRNYIINFNGLRPSPSTVLTIIIQLIHAFNGTIESLYYFTTFVCVFITMLAYRYSKDATPHSFIFLCVTQYFLATLTALKQSYASALATVVFVLILEYRTPKTDLLAILCIIVACLSHPTGFILIPLFIMVKVRKTRLSMVLYVMAMIIIAFFFEPFMLLVARIVNPIVPKLGSHILLYFSEPAETANNTIAMSFIKGLPYYFIAVYGVIKRRVLRKQISNYDNYLLVVTTGSFLYFVSLYSVWLSRFVYLFSFVSFVFFGMLMKQIKIGWNRLIYTGFVFFSLAIVTYRFLYVLYKLSGGF